MSFVTLSRIAPDMYGMFLVKGKQRELLLMIANGYNGALDVGQQDVNMRENHWIGWQRVATL